MRTLETVIVASLIFASGSAFAEERGVERVVADRQSESTTLESVIDGTSNTFMDEEDPDGEEVLMDRVIVPNNQENRRNEVVPARRGGAATQEAITEEVGPARAGTVRDHRRSRNTSSETEMAPTSSTLFAPTDLAIVRPSSGPLRLAWRDNSTTEGGFFVDYMEANLNDDVRADWTPWATFFNQGRYEAIETGLRSNRLPSLTQGTRYCFQVRAYSRAGDGYGNPQQITPSQPLCEVYVRQ